MESQPPDAWPITGRECFASDRVLYSQHAKREMWVEERGRIWEHEVDESMANAEVVETYPSDKPFPSCLLVGKTASGRPLHVVLAYEAPSGIVIVITVYEPDPERWVEHRRRVKL